MTKWPKEWIDAAEPWSGSYAAGGEKQWYGGEDVLRRLQDIGALKDPPKKREWWICEICGEGYVSRRPDDRPKTCIQHEHEWIHVTEADDDEA